MKKRFAGLSAAILIFAFVLAGCSGSSNDNGVGSNAATSSGSASATADSTAAASDSGGSDSAASQLKPYKLTMYYPATPPKDLKLVQDEINKYLKDKINATIELKPIDWGAWGDKVTLMFASNEKFDIIFTASYQGYTANALKGQFLQIDDLLDKYGQGAKETLGPDWIKGSQVNGHSYALPALKEFAGSVGVLMRKDLVDKYNIDLDAIHSYSDLTPIFQKIKDNEPGVTPLVQGSLNLAGLFEGYYVDGLGGGHGSIDPDSGDTNVKNDWEFPKISDIMHQVREWYLNGFINKDAATMTTDQIYNVIKAGKGFAWAEGTKPGKDAEMSVQLGVDVVQKDLIRPQTTTNEATGAMLAISRTSGDPERAMMFMNLLYTDPYLLNLLDFGIEGKHYVKNSSGMLEFPEGVDGQTSGYNPGTNWMFGNQFNTYLWSNEDPDKWEKFKAFNESSVKSPGLGFAFDQTNVNNEAAAVANVDAQYNIPFQTGSLDLDKNLPEYLNKLKEAGLDKIIAEKQKQFNAWLETQK